MTLYFIHFDSDKEYVYDWVYGLWLLLYNNLKDSIVYNSTISSFELLIVKLVLIYTMIVYMAVSSRTATYKI